MPESDRDDYTEEDIHNAWVEQAPVLDSTVTLAEYDPEWPALFDREAKRLRGILGEDALVLEHVGSTSVPGLCAKPIIDILLIVADSDDEDAYVPQLEAAGYRLVIREPEREKHRAFKGPDTDVNLHVYSPDNGQTERYRLFRDRLIAHEDERKRYEAEKRELASRTWKYIQQYADAKTGVIDEIIERARAARLEVLSSTESAKTQYDGFARRYAAHAETSSTNAHYDRPAMVELAGDVAGKRVLDVGSAAGHLGALLAAKGADVLGVDASAGMVAIAREKFGDVAKFETADVSRPMPFLADGSIDVITASLVLHYLKEWAPALAEFRRVLKPGGLLVFSVHHPGEDWRWFGKRDYFRLELLEDEFPAGQKVRFYRRPLSWTFGAVRDAGFAVDRLVEPMPDEAIAGSDPKWYAKLRTEPRFLYFRTVRENPASR
ncbi:GrpB family protein [Amycolatopsis sp. QT-25]|uniref:GrpB family protein n=1 Tax=Amycolatopsis sp. QT-25 TaxID=3034022 RepID=UPI0023EDAF21|nr:GrpB family protein [Amycolatopsis sp. QT-25]WET82106.1 GrpB family protein [Amycolatopsis sp. QT-25]